MAGMYVSMHVSDDEMRAECRESAHGRPNAHGERVFVLVLADTRQEVCIYCTRFQLANIAAAIEAAIMDEDITRRHPCGCRCGASDCPESTVFNKN